MKIKSLIVTWVLLAAVLSSCGPAKPTFDITGSPNPLIYGWCGGVLTINVTGPGDGLRINSIIAGYNLFNGSGTKTKVGTVTLSPSPGASPVNYTGTLTLKIATGGGSASAPEVAIMDFGEGRIDIAATVYATFLAPSSTGPAETYYFTSTKSIPVVPCAPTLTPIVFTPTPTFTPNPGALKKPKSTPAPSCSVEPNNPNCKP